MKLKVKYYEFTQKLVFIMVCAISRDRFFEDFEI